MCCSSRAPGRIGDWEAEAISEHLTRRPVRHGNRPALHDPRNRHRVLRAVRPSPARIAAPEPDAWLPVADISARLDAELQALLGDGPPVGGPPGPRPGASVPGATVVTPEPAPVPPVPVPAVPVPPAAGPPGPAPAWQEAAGAAGPAVAPAATEPRVAQRPRGTGRVRTRPAAGPIARVGAVALGVVVLASGIPVLTGRSSPLRTATIRTGAEAVTLSSRAERVADLLAEAGVRLRAGDRVVPAPHRRLHSGMVVRVMRAFPVTVDLDGVTRRIRTTARTVTALRRELGVPAAMLLVGGRDRLRPGTRVVLRTPHRVRITVDGRTRAVRTTAPDVAGLLAAADVRLGPHDEVTPAPHTPVHEGLAVRVHRVAFEDRTEEMPLEAPVVVRDDPGLPVGQQRVLQAGSPGRARRTWRVRLRDGQVVDRSLVGSITVAEPVARIVARGTRRAAPTPVPPSPAPVRARGTATWYEAPAGTCAHLTLPFGTIVHLRNPRTGATARCRVADRGPQSWTGHIIDLSPDVFRALAPLGQGVVAVELAW